MFNVVLVAPEIPPNTGNVIRLCANSGPRLHLVKPLGFDLSDKQLRRAGLDYHEYADLQVHASFDALVERERPSADRLWCFTTRASRLYTDAGFQAGDWLVFGSETQGLAPALRESFVPERRLRLPMRPDNRSLNLSNAVAVAVTLSGNASGSTLSLPAGTTTLSGTTEYVFTAQGAGVAPIWKAVAVGGGDFKADGSVAMTAAIIPNAANTIALGSAAAEWADLYLGDSAVIYRENDSSNTITSAATGWTFAKDVTITGLDLTLGAAAAGVVFTATAEGVLTIRRFG